MNYQEWIDAHVPETPLGMCRAICTEMKEAFPELTIVRGHYDDAFWGIRSHWWLLTKSGEIIDPTKSQFPDQGAEYIPWIEGEPEPTGICANCGKSVYKYKTVCSPKCHTEFAASLQ